MTRILDTPVTTNKMTLFNRLVMPPMATEKSSVDGNVSDALCDYYREKLQGKHIGLIITEHSYIKPLDVVKCNGTHLPWYCHNSDGKYYINKLDIISATMSL